MTLSKYNEVMESVKITNEMRDRILSNVDEKLRVGDANITEFDSTRKKKSGNNVIKFVKRYGSMAAVFALLILGTYGVIRTVGLGGSKSETATTAPAEYETDSAAETMEEATSEAMDYAEVTEEATEDAALPESADSVMTPSISAAEGAKGSESENAIDFTGSAKEDSASEEAESQAITKDEFSSASELSQALGFDITDIESLKNEATEVQYFKYDEGGEILYKTDNNSISYFASEIGLFTGSEELDVSSFENKKLMEFDSYRVIACGDDTTYKFAYWEKDGIMYSLVSDKGMTEEEIQTYISK
ncbi:hypothetical protein SAMN02910263_00012 [Butyrivibrio sp. INlla16]|nr:hypothetical protein SAMN02910263_00012 [Butyrivibrio sp. INlla16]